MSLIVNLENLKHQIEEKYNINQDMVLKQWTLKEKALARLLNEFQITFGENKLFINTVALG